MRDDSRVALMVIVLVVSKGDRSVAWLVDEKVNETVALMVRE